MAESSCIPIQHTATATTSQSEVSPGSTALEASGKDLRWRSDRGATHRRESRARAGTRAGNEKKWIDVLDSANLDTHQGLKKLVDRHGWMSTRKAPVTMMGLHGVLRLWGKGGNYTTQMAAAL